MDSVCVECECAVEQSEQSLVCVGPCCRRFHSECVKETRSQGAWRCPLCTLGVARCSRCRRFETRDFMVPCTECTREMLCPECAVDGWVCEGHACSTCGALTSETSWRCVRCPVAYCRGCRPAASLLIASRVIKCVIHVKETLPPLDVAILKRRTSRRQRALQEEGENAFEAVEVETPSVPRENVSKRSREQSRHKEPSVASVPKRRKPPPPQAAILHAPRLQPRRTKPFSLIEKMRAALQARRPTLDAPAPAAYIDEDQEDGLGLPAFGAASKVDDDDKLNFLERLPSRPLPATTPPVSNSLCPSILVATTPVPSFAPYGFSGPARPPSRDNADDILARLEAYGL